MLVEAGLPRDTVPSAYWVLSTYTIGSVLLQIEHSRLRRERAGQGKQNLMTLMSVLEAELGDPESLASVLSLRYDDKQFEFGLAAVISGLQNVVEAARGAGDHAAS